MKQYSITASAKKMGLALRGIKLVLWMCIIGFGFTLINTTGLIFRSGESYIDVRAQGGGDSIHDNGVLSVNKGVYAFQSESLLDRVLYERVRGYSDFPAALFTFAICLVLLLTVHKLDLANPFTLSIARNIGLIGILYIVYGIIKILISFYSYRHFADLAISFSPSNDTMGYELSNIKIGFFVLILAFIYKVGVIMQEERRLTV